MVYIFLKKIIHKNKKKHANQLHIWQKLDGPSIRDWTDYSLICHEQTRACIFSTRAAVFATCENYTTIKWIRKHSRNLFGDIPLTHCSVYVLWQLMQCAEWKVPCAATSFSSGKPANISRPSIFWNKMSPCCKASSYILQSTRSSQNKTSWKSISTSRNSQEHQIFWEWKTKRYYYSNPNGQ